MDRQNIYEWLMTYGWVIIASLIVIGSLGAYFYAESIEPATVCETSHQLYFSFNGTLMASQHINYEDFKNIFYLPDDLKLECDGENCSVYVLKEECRIL